MTWRLKRKPASTMVIVADPCYNTGGHRMVLTDRNRYAIWTSCSSNDSNYAHRLLVLAHLLQTIVVYPQGDHWCDCHWRGSPLVLNCKYSIFLRFYPFWSILVIYFWTSSILWKYPHHATNAAGPNLHLKLMPSRAAQRSRIGQWDWE